MSEDQPISLKDFGASFMGFLQQAAAQAPVEEPIFVRLLRTHFGAELTTRPIVAEAFELSDHPNLHLAIEAYLAQEGRSAELLGIIGGFPYVDFSLSCSYLPGKANLRLYWAPYLFAGLVYLSTAISLETWLLRQPDRFVAFFLVVAGVLLLSRACQDRWMARHCEFIFEEEPDPAVHSLLLNS